MTDPALPDRWQAGDQPWFEYHCRESPDSVDAPAWRRSHQRVTVLALNVNDSEGMTRAERDEAAMPFTYTVQFADGLTWDAVEDELTATRDEWYRPDPPAERPQTDA